VVLFDEIEKAHPDVFHVLLQLLDDGRLTDSQGRTVNFKNTVVIMTSNIGSSILLEAASDGEDFSDEIKNMVMDSLKVHFRPEFLNRVDDVVLFKPLGRREMFRIIDLILDELRERLSDRDIKLEITEPAKDRILDLSYSPAYGARPLKRFVQKVVETDLGRKLISGEVHEGDTAVIDAEGEQLLIKVQ